MTSTVLRFNELALSDPILQTLEEIGYESPSPIQAETIPHLLEGKDLVGQAQTGTGKTAAFALPLLTRLKLSKKQPQVLVLTPTRELAIQVAEAFQVYARLLKGFHVLPIYGGQSTTVQLRQLKRGVHVVVGTPGRIMDHLRRKSLCLDSLTTLVLDEADEMLKMGFIEDVEWILSHTPKERQTALFSATMPEAIRKVARRHLRSPKEIKIKTRTSTVETITQRYWQVSGTHKLDALTRILEIEEFDAVLIFVRTKTETTSLAEKLEARGFASSALNGDMNQTSRERTVERLKNKKLDILVATDVAARGLDVSRITHVINYDIPYDTEAYVHRIGRTGRAGRKGNAILFVAPREVRMLRSIEKATKQPITPMQIPSAKAISNQRVEQFKKQIINVMDTHDLDFFHQIITQMKQEHDVDVEKIASALSYLVQRERPLNIKDKKVTEDKPARKAFKKDKSGKTMAAGKGQAAPDTLRLKNYPDKGSSRKDIPRSKAPRLKNHPEIDMVRFRIKGGRNQGITPKDIVGAIANEADINSQFIGQIKLYDDFSTVDLPDGMPKETFQHLKKVRVREIPLDISRLQAEKQSHKNRPRKHTQK